MAATETPPPAEDYDPTFRLLFEAAESEKKPAPAPAEPGKSLAQVLAEPEETPEAKAEKEKAEKEKAEKEAKEKAEKEKAAGGAPAGGAPEGEHKVRVRRRPPPTPTPTPAPTPPPPEKQKTEEEKFEEGLLDEEKDQLELARYAEQKNPAKYKGYSAKVSKFLKDHQTYLEKNPKATEPGSDEAAEYQAWLTKNSVTLPARELRTLEHERITEKAKAEAAKESDAKFGELHDENFRRDTEPKVRAEADAFFNRLAAEALPADLAKAVKDLGLEKAKAAYPLEYRVSAEVMTETTADVEEFRRITTYNPRTNRPLKPFDPANPQHLRILDFVREQCALFQKDGLEGKHKFLKQDGKSFLTRDDYFNLKPADRGPYWTFKDDQIVQIAQFAAKKRIEDKIKAEHKLREDDGYVRKTTAAPTEPPAPPPPGSPPAPRPTQIPSAGGTAEDKPERAFSLLMGE